VKKAPTLRGYWTSKCAGCALKAQCTPAKERRIRRWEHEAVLDAMQQRLDRAPETMRRSPSFPCPLFIATNLNAFKQGAFMRGVPG
jgi:hypothetical protein